MHIRQIRNTSMWMSGSGQQVEAEKLKTWDAEIRRNPISAFQPLRISVSTPRSPQSPSFRSDGEVRRTLGLPSGDQSEVEPPGPIPNPEVKRLSANGSGTIGPVRVGRRQVKARHLGNKMPGSFFAGDAVSDRSLTHKEWANDMVQLTSPSSPAIPRACPTRCLPNPV